MTLTIKDKQNSFNSNYDCSKHEYKIYKITNMISGLYYISYSRVKYLSRVKEDLLRKPTENFMLLFNGIDDKNDIMIELLNVVEADNIYFVKQHIKNIEKDNNAIIKRCDKPFVSDKCKSCNDGERNIEYDDDDNDDDDEPIKSINLIKEQKKANKANEPQKKYKYPDRKCDKCNAIFAYKNFSRHYKKCGV